MSIFINKKHMKKTLVAISILVFAMVTILFLIQMFVPEEARAYYLNFQTNRIFSADPSNQSAGGTLANGFIEIAQQVTTSILLPVGIILTTWRTMYLAICPLMMKVDPLDMMRSGRYSREMTTEGSVLNNSGQNIVENLFGGNYHTSDAFDNNRAGNKSSRTKNSKYAGSALDASYFEGAYTTDKNCIGEQAQYCIKIEVKHMFVALLVVFAVWGVLQVVLKLAVVFLGLAESSADLTGTNTGS